MFFFPRSYLIVLSFQVEFLNCITFNLFLYFDLSEFVKKTLFVPMAPVFIFKLASKYGKAILGIAGFSTQKVD